MKEKKGEFTFLFDLSWMAFGAADVPSEKDANPQYPYQLADKTGKSHSLFVWKFFFSYLHKNSQHKVLPAAAMIM